MTPHYKRVQRIARQFGLSDSLKHIWAYSLHICYGWDLRPEYERPKKVGSKAQVRDFIHEFHLDLHVREILLHAVKSSQATRSLKTWSDLAAFHNAINKQSNKTSDSRKNVLLTLHRIGHQQISSFDRVDHNYIGRYWSLFRRKPIADLIERNFGMTALEYFFFVAGLFTVYLERPEADVAQSLSAFAIPSDALHERLRTISDSPQHIRARLVATQRFDSSWAYTFNELASTPLVTLRSHEPNKFLCPRPQLLIRRLLAGAYFDLVAKQGFSEAFGEGVDHLVGDLITRSDQRLLPRKPTPYRTGSGVRHGADWILSDESGHVFVECKAARIPLQAQVAPTAEDVSKGLERLADAIVQNYANIKDALDGRTEWQSNDLPVYSLIVTLEDWNLFSPIASEALQTLVVEKLTVKSLNISLVTSIPYVVTSVTDLPDLTHAMAEHGIEELLREKCTEKYGQYLVSSYLKERKYDSGASLGLFKTDSDELFAEFKLRISDRSDMP